MSDQNNRYFPYFTKFESKFFDDLTWQVLDSNVGIFDLGHGNILNNNLNQDDFSNDDLLCEYSKAIQLSEKSKEAELTHYKKLAVDSLIKINNLNAQLVEKEDQIMTLRLHIKQAKKHLE
jgi:hypothetical protein